MLGRDHRGATRLLGAAALVGVVLATAAQARHTGLDFWTRYAAGELVAEGRSPYDEAALVARVHELGDFGFLPFYDAPPVAAACRLLALLPLRPAYFALTVLSFASCVALGRVLGGRDRTTWVLAAVGLLVFTPARTTLILGQLDLVAMVATLHLGARWPVVAMAKPQTVVGVAATLVARRWRRHGPRLLVGAAVSAAIVVVVAAVVASSATWTDWVDAIRDREGDAGRPWPWAITAAGFGVLGWGIARQRRRDPREPPVDALCVVACVPPLLAALGNWNPPWFLGLAFPLAALLFALDRGEVRLRRPEAALLTVTAAAAAGEGLFEGGLFGADRVIVPVLILAAFLTGLVAWGHLPAWLAAVVLVLNLGIAAAQLDHEQRSWLSMAVAVSLLYLTFRVRPAPLVVPGAAPAGERPGTGSHPAGAPRATLTA